MTNIKIMTLNVNKYRNIFFQGNTLSKLRKKLLELDADIVLLQEVPFHDKRRRINNEELENFSDLVWKDFSFHKNSSSSLKGHGNVILSKFPIVEEQFHDITNHQLEQRGFIFNKIRVFLKENKYLDVNVINTHLDLTTFGRLKQMKNILDFLHSKISTEEILIIGGDFNDWNHKVDKFLIDQQNHFVFKSVNLKTFPSFFNFLSLDRIYVANGEIKNVRVFKNNLIKRVQTDHLCLINEILIDT